MSGAIEATLGRVAGGQDLSMQEMADAVHEIMRGDWTDAQIGLLLTALRAKGETVAEVAGAAEALRKHMTRIPHRHEEFQDDHLSISYRMDRSLPLLAKDASHVSDQLAGFVRTHADHTMVRAS